MGTQRLSLSNGDLISVSSDITRTNYSFLQDIPFDTLKRYIEEGMVTSTFRIFVLYPDETINYQIPNEDIKMGGNYNENYQNGQRRTLTFSLYNYTGRYTPDINNFWAGTKLRFDMGAKYSESATYWFQRGIFVIKSVSPSLTATGREVSINAMDKYSLFEESTGKLPSAFEVDIGEEIEDIINTIQRTAMGNGSVFDPKPCIYYSGFKGRKTQAKISMSAGSTYGSILAELGTQLSAEYFYNSNGNLVFAPINEVTNDIDKPLIAELETSKGQISQLSFDFDYNTIVNDIIIIGTTQSGATFISEALNEDPSSPLCYQRIGKRVGEVVNDSSIYSQVLADERAQYELRQQLIFKSSTSAAIVFNPIIQVNNTIAVSDSFFDLVHERFIINSVSCALDASNQMNISFSNLRNLPFTVK